MLTSVLALRRSTFVRPASHIGQQFNRHRQNCLMIEKIIAPLLGSRNPQK